MTQPENLLAEWSALLLGSLAEAGVRDVVISPGSRSTPFVLAAAAHPDLRCHDAIDERAAAFFALGQARASGRPSLLLCTSGSAPGHYLPAVIEAGAAYLPLLVLSADRPFELHGCAAAQTIDQVKLFGDHARAYLDPGLPDPDPGALRALRRLAAQAVHLALAPTPGAVHINARARKPLEPRPPQSPAAHELAAQVAALRARPLTRVYPPQQAPDPAGLADLAARCAAAKAGLLVCGPALPPEAAAAVFALARSTGFPLLCEAASGLRFQQRDPAVALLSCDAYGSILGAPLLRAALAPDLIVQLGAPPTPASWELYLDAHPDCPRAVIAPHGWNDPRGDADVLLLGEVGAAAQGLCALLDTPAADRAGSSADRLGSSADRGAAPVGWAARWRRAEVAAWAAVETALAAGGPLSEAAVVRAVISALPRGSLLMLGNSLPIREVDSYCPGGLCEVRVLAQRGASGIDGLIAGATGAASLVPTPTTLLLGDISLLHDLSGLGLAAQARRPLALVVLNNGGGRIFDTLPIAGAASEAHLAHFTTPHRAALGHAAHLFGLPHVRVEGAAAVAAAVRAAHQHPGATLIEAVVPADSAAAVNRHLSRGLAALEPRALFAAAEPRARFATEAGP